MKMVSIYGCHSEDILQFNSIYMEWMGLLGGGRG